MVQPDKFSRSVLSDFIERLRSWMDGLEKSKTVLEAKSKQVEEEHRGRHLRLETIVRLLSKKKPPKSVPRLDTAAAYAAALDLTLEEFYCGLRRTAQEKRFHKEVAAFEKLLAFADEEGIRDVLKAIDHAMRETKDRRAGRSPPLYQAGERRTSST